MTNRVPPPGTPNAAAVTTRPAAEPTPTDPAAAAPAATANKSWLSKQVDGVVNAAASLFVGNQTGKPVKGTSYDWNPARPVDAVPLTPILDQLANSEDGRKVAAQIAKDVHTATGIPGTEALAQQALANPRVLTEGLIVTPGQLSGGLSALATMKGHTPVGTGTFRLPQKFDLDELGSIPYENPFKLPAKPGPDGKPPLPGETDALKMLAPGLWRGSLPGKLSDAQAKRNTVVAEVFDRLSSNANKADGDKFEVEFRGTTYSSVPDFMKGLREAGYEVSATFRTRTADFGDLKAGEPGKVQPLAAPMMLKTGVKDAKGNEAIVPVPHSELVVNIKSPNGAEPNLDSKIRFFQGIDGIGFFPADIWHEGTWMGGVNRETVTGDQAQKAVEVAAGLTGLVEQAAINQKLYTEGYGLTGVCNDSIAIVQQAVLGKVNEWPLLMKDDLLLKELAKQPPSEMRNILERAIRETPNDVKTNLLGTPGTATPNADTRRRILASIAYADGMAPWTRTEEARKILKGE